MYVNCEYINEYRSNPRVNERCLSISENKVQITSLNFFQALFSPATASVVFITARKSVLISLSAVHLYDFHIFTAIYSSIHGFIWKQHNDRLLIGLLAQLVEHCTGIVEVMGSWIPWFSEKREINIWTQLLGSRGSFTAGTGAKKIIISFTGGKSAKSVVFKKTRNES